MSKEEDEQNARLDRAREIALFRYMLIRGAADPALTGRQRGRLVRALASVPHTDPAGRTVRISRWSLDRWIAEWHRGGFDALVPSPRQSQARTPPEVFELASALKKENPARTAAQIRRILSAQHGWAPDERTLQRMFHRTGLVALSTPAAPAVFGRFEADRPNEIWTGDALCRDRHNASYADYGVMQGTAIDGRSRARPPREWWHKWRHERPASPSLLMSGRPERRRAWPTTRIRRGCGYQDRWRRTFRASPPG